MWVAAALLMASASSCDVPAKETGVQLGLEYDAFDGLSGPYAWRSLLNAGCADAAVSLLAAYSKANTPTLTQDQALELRFHMGQTLAMAGREKEAIPHLEQAAAPDAPNEWRTYVGATLAFLRHDLAALAAARAAYATIAPNSMRLRIIDGMVACPKEPYAKAVHCRM